MLEIVYGVNRTFIQLYQCDFFTFKEVSITNYFYIIKIKKCLQNDLTLQMDYFDGY